MLSNHLLRRSDLAPSLEVPSLDEAELAEELLMGRTEEVDGF